MVTRLLRLSRIVGILLLVSRSSAATLSIINGTAIDPGSDKIIPNAVITIEGDSITSVSAGEPSSAKKKPEKVIDARGKFILPGYIDTHVHFFQSGGLFARPDVVDLTSVRPYADEVAMVKKNLPDTFARYLRSGITSVVDIGGPMWNFEVRRLSRETEKAPRVAVAGPLISSVARPQLDLGDPPIVKIDTPEEARALVRKLVLQKADYIKIWYIVNDEHPVEQFRPIVRAVVQESHANFVRVAVHATELEAARAAVEEGADLLVHSVTDKLVDDRFVQLLKQKHVILTPTLVVFERYGRTFAHQLNLTKSETNWGSPEVLATLDVTKLPAEKVPERIKTALSNPEVVLERIRKTYEIAFKNLKTLEDAGVTIATGTDAGNIGTIHGPAIFREFQLMHEAGLTPQQILVSTTANAALVFDGKAGPRVGVLQEGRLADLVILNSNPLEDIEHASDIAIVVKNGVAYPAESILAR